MFRPLALVLRSRALRRHIEALLFSAHRRIGRISGVYLKLAMLIAMPQCPIPLSTSGAKQPDSTCAITDHLRIWRVTGVQLAFALKIGMPQCPVLFSSRPH